MPDRSAIPARPDANPATLTRVAAPQGWARWLPGLQVLLGYRREWLADDLKAGLVLTAVLVPVAVAYAAAAGVPAIAGLYATVAGLFAYALFGPSRVLVLGPDSSLVALILGVVLPLSGGDGARAIALAAAMACVAGVLCIAAGLARLGFVTELLSKPIRYGYMNGIALTIVVSQLPALFGFEAQGAGLIAEGRAFVDGLLAGRTHPAALALGAGTLAAILLMMKRVRALPGALIAVAAAILAVQLLQLDLRAGVQVLGPLPQGLPLPAWPAIRASDLGPVLTGGLAIALVAFADTSVLAKTYAARGGQLASPNQEAVALGAANLAAGLFQGVAVSASASRTPVAEAAGARTQLTAVVGAAVVVGLLLWGPNLLARLPMAALAAVVIASALALFEVSDLKRIYRIQRWEFWLSIVCLAGVALFGAIPGIGFAVAIAIVEFLWDAWRPHSAVLGRVDGIKGYHDIARYPHAARVPGLVLFRWDAPLFFANAELFRDRVLEAVAESPLPVRRVVVGAEPVTSVDVTAADTVSELADRLEAAGIELCFAEMKDPVKDKLRRFGLMHRLGDERFFATIGEAVGRYVRAFDVDWRDREDREDRAAAAPPADRPSARPR